MKLPHFAQRRLEIANGDWNRGESGVGNLGNFCGDGSSRQLKEEETVDGDGGKDSVREGPNSRREKKGVSTGGEARR